MSINGVFAQEFSVYSNGHSWLVPIWRHQQQGRTSVFKLSDVDFFLLISEEIDISHRKGKKKQTELPTTITKMNL